MEKIKKINELQFLKKVINQAATIALDFEQNLYKHCNFEYNSVQMKEFWKIINRLHELTFELSEHFYILQERKNNEKR